MTTFNSEIAADLGVTVRPDLPHDVVELIKAIGTRIVSPDIPPPLRATAHAVVRSVNAPGASQETIRDANDTLRHLRTVLGEDHPDVPSAPVTLEPDPALERELQTTLEAARRRGDVDAVNLVRAALGMTATT